MRNRLSVVAVCAVLLIGAPMAEAQRPFTIGLSAGPSLPMSDFNDSHEIGLNAAAHVGISLPASALGVRLEGFYNLFDNTDYACPDFGPCNLPGIATSPIRVIGAAANVVYNFVEGSVGPYVIGGVGVYDVKPERSDGATSLGFNAGVGGRFRVAAIGAFIETRLHATTGDLKAQYIPVTFGIEF
jgi:hypothetical protein